MVKIEKYKGDKTYMFPNGAIASPEVVKANFPAIEVFPHIIETDEDEQVLFAVENLAATRSFHNIDESLSEEEAIAAIEAIRNAPPAEPTPTAEERIAAMMEFEAMLKL